MNPRVPDGLSRIILTCLEKDRGDRYQNADLIFSELSRLAEELPLQETATPQTKPRTSREITVTVGVRKIWLPALILVLIAATIVTLMLIRQPSFVPNRVLVTVFQNQTEDSEFDPILKAAADRIAEGLARVDLIEVWPNILELSPSSGMNPGDPPRA